MTSNSTIHDPHNLNLAAAYVEHRLGEEERAQFERHLVKCTECRELLATYARGSKANSRAVSTTARRFGAGISASGWLALAASAVLAIGVSVYLRVGPTGAPVPPEQPQLAPPAVETPAAPRTVPAPAVATPGQALPSASPRENLSKTRGGDRHVGDKTFRLEAGAWVDTVYKPLQLLPTTDVSTSEKRTALLQEKPALKPYADLGPQVIVVVDGMVYRFDVK